jgi:hypothetical protein
MELIPKAIFCDKMGMVKFFAPKAEKAMYST